MSEVRKALARYADILGGRESPWYLKCQRFPVDWGSSAPLEEKWQIHDEAVSALKSGSPIADEKPDNSLLALKLDIVKKILKECTLCERRCSVDRTAGQRGHCEVLESRISSEFMHYGEEPELVPSYTIFFSGCTFDCVFCQNWDISQRVGGGEYFPPQTIADFIGKKAGLAKNVNWVGGDPTSNLEYILEVLALSSEAIPQVWNSNMYLSTETMKLLDGVVDVYLTDFKYGSDDCAKRLSGIDDYWEIITRNHLLAKKQCEVIVRHLVLPNHVECCSRPILKWLADNFLKSVRVNVMGQYRPEYLAFRYPEINRSLKRHEFSEAYEYAVSLGLNLTD